MIVETIGKTKDLLTLKIDELMGSLLSHQLRIDKNKGFSLQTTFESQVSISRDRGWGKGRFRRKGQSRRISV